jgi:hypothetical protein
MQCFLLVQLVIMKKVLFLASLLACSAQSAQDTPGVLQEVPNLFERINMGLAVSNKTEIVRNSVLTSLLFTVAAYAARYMPITPAQLRTPKFVALVGVASSAATLLYQCLQNRFHVVHTSEDVGTLRNIIIGSDVTSLDHFSGTTAETHNTTLQNVMFLAEHRLQSIGDLAFSKCYALKSIVIPDGVMTIEASAFFGCKSLEAVFLPNSVTSINNWAFFCCRALRDIHWPEGIHEIGHHAFYDCTSLRAITLPASLQEIGASAFGSCNALQEITFRGNTRIENGTFSHTRSFKKVTFDSENFAIDYYIGLNFSSVKELVFTKYNPADKIAFLTETFSQLVQDGCTAVFPNGERCIFSNKKWELVVPE